LPLVLSGNWRRLRSAATHLRYHYQVALFPQHHCCVSVHPTFIVLIKGENRCAEF
jgi:hypothetical protein